MSTRNVLSRVHQPVVPIKKAELCAILGQDFTEDEFQVCVRPQAGRAGRCGVVWQHPHSPLCVRGRVCVGGGGNQIRLCVRVMWLCMLLAVRGGVPSRWWWWWGGGPRQALFLDCTRSCCHHPLLPLGAHSVVRPAVRPRCVSSDRCRVSDRCWVRCVPLSPVPRCTARSSASTSELSWTP
jgi:hypothetical protein